MLPRPMSAELHNLYLTCLRDATWRYGFASAFVSLYLPLSLQ